MTHAESRSVTVVVPTRNRRRLLIELLSALEEQRRKPSQVIVVDDASEDGTREVLSDWERDNHVALYLERPSGSYVARNLGWRHTDSDIIAFTDDDCIPEQSWLSELLIQFDDPEVAGVQGSVHTDGAKSTPFTHQVEQLTGGAPYRTCNVAYRREVLERIGGFEEGLLWYADNLLGYQATRLGQIAFSPKAVVWHPPRAREWRDRGIWLERFRADARHRFELQRLGVEPFRLPDKGLPIALWVVRPIVKQSAFHAVWGLHHPIAYLRGIKPLAGEKWEMMLALRELWRVDAETPSGNSRPPGSLELTALHDDPKVSAIVVTKGRAELLKATLEALDQQSWGNREVVVVDNGPDEDTRSLAISHKANYVVSTGGLGSARQAGVEASSGEIVAFTDDDCLPAPEWMEELAVHLRQGNLVGVQGKTVAESGPPGYRALKVSKANKLYQTCNIAYRREAIDAAGGFDIAFEGWFEDTALGARVRERGEIGFAPLALVVHRRRRSQVLNRNDWARVLRDERRLANRYPNFYRRNRGPGILTTVFGRWMVGSALKTLAREAPGGLGHPRAYLKLLLMLAQERKELARAMIEDARQTSRSRTGSHRFE